VLQIVCRFRDMSTNGATYQRAAASLGYTDGTFGRHRHNGLLAGREMILGTRRLAMETQRNSGRDGAYPKELSAMNTGSMTGPMTDLLST